MLLLIALLTAGGVSGQPALAAEQFRAKGKELQDKEAWKALLEEGGFQFYAHELHQAKSSLKDEQLDEIFAGDSGFWF